jgi:hypothetical protein
MERHNAPPCRTFRFAYAANQFGVRPRHPLNMRWLIISLQLVLEDAAASKSQTLQTGP